MSAIISKRVTGTLEGDFVVFAIGMRINRWWKFWKWMRVAGAMPRMLQELEAHPELGFLGGERWFGRTTIVLSYWRTTEQLIAYARSKTGEHLPAWRAFNQLVGTNGDIGIWHETYRVRASEFETMYVNMPRFGLGRVGQLVEATGRREHAADRLTAGSTAGSTAAVPPAEKL
jgi:hypothetical protein